MKTLIQNEAIRIVTGLSQWYQLDRLQKEIAIDNQRLFLFLQNSEQFMSIILAYMLFVLPQ